MGHEWIVEERDGNCAIMRADGAIKGQICPRQRLKQQVAPHGVVADIYTSLCTQLDEAGKATVTAIDLTLPNSFNNLSF